MIIDFISTIRSKTILWSTYFTILQKDFSGQQIDKNVIILK